MLNTDLHNPSIKEERRMTPEGFVRNNRGIGADGGDLPTEMLEEIFDRIKKSPFSLKEDDDARQLLAAGTVGGGNASVNFEGLFGNKEEKKRKEEFQKEREELMSSSEQVRASARRASGSGAHASAKRASGSGAPTLLLCSRSECGKSERQRRNNAVYGSLPHPPFPPPSSLAPRS
jgi:brefeldin A-inhibited guanine nucleotide-exchange protein